MAALRRLLALSLPLAAALALPARLQAQVPELERGIYEIAVAGSAQRITTRVLLDGTRVLLPLQEILLQTGIPGERSGDAWQFQWPPPTFDTRLDAATGRFRKNSADGQLPPGSWTLTDGALYLDSLALHLLFDATLRSDPAQLLATLSHPETFPGQRRLAEEQRRELRLRTADRRPGTAHVPYPGTTGGVALNWDASALVRDQSSYGVARGVLGVSVLGGALEVGGSTSVGSELDTGERIARFVRPFPTNPWLQQLSLGSLVSPTPVPRYVEGVYLSNAPFIPPTDFQEIAYRPVLPPGWTAEVYEGETLVGVVDAQDAESVDLPVGYGFTPVRIRMVGPAGQERTEQLQYIVPTTRLPSRRVEYNLGFGNCRSGPCDQYGFADVSRGFTPWLTLGAGAGYLSTADSSRVTPYATLSLNPLPNLAFDAHAEGTRHARAAVQYLGRRNQSLSASLAWFDPDDATLALGGTYAQAAASLYLFDRYLTASGQLHLQPDAGVGDGQVFAGMPIGRGYVGTHWYRSSTAADQLGVRTFWRTSSAPVVNRALNLGATASFSRTGFEVAELTANLQPQRTASLTAALQWRPEQNRTSFNLTYTLRTGAGTAQARSVVTAQEPQLLVGMSGGVAAWPGAMASSYGGAVGRAGVAGTVFMDANGNGSLDPGEARVAGVPVIADGRRTVSDDRGDYAIWDLNAVRTTRLWVDSLRIADPRLAPVRAEYVVRLPANTFTRRDIPLVRTRELIGRLRSPLARAPLGGIAVELRSEGGVVQQTRTFSDGEYYFPRVAPGRYTVTVAPASLAALAVVARPASLELDFQSGDAYRLPDITLIPEADAHRYDANGNPSPPAGAANDGPAPGAAPRRQQEIVQEVWSRRSARRLTRPARAPAVRGGQDVARSGTAWP